MQQITNSFQVFELSDTEIATGSIFSNLQIQVLQNRRALVAEEKIALDYDPENPGNFIQQEAAKKAELQLLTYLIDCSNAALEVMQAARAAEAK